MKYHFVPMNDEYAKIIVKQWKYEPEYSIHDYENEADHILDKDSWGIGLFAVLNEDDELVGELTIEFFNKNDNCVEYEDVNKVNLNDAEMWVGFGLKPELTGRGLGLEFITACINYALKAYTYEGEAVRLGVPAFNERAQKVYKRLGFEEFNRTEGEIEEKKYEAVQMKKFL